jgi:hypothetical protein
MKTTNWIEERSMKLTNLNYKMSMKLQTKMKSKSND